MTYPPSGEPSVPPAGNPYGPADPYSAPPAPVSGYPPYSQHPVEGGQYSAAPQYPGQQMPYPGAPQAPYPGAGQFPGQGQPPYPQAAPFPGAQPQYPGAPQYPGQQFPGQPMPGQPGFPGQPMPGPGGRGGTAPWLVGGLVLLVVVLLIGGGVAVALNMGDDSGNANVAASGTADPGGGAGPGASATPDRTSAKPAGPGATYKAVDDMCKLAADLSPVGDWAKTKSREFKYQSSSDYGSISSCDFTLRTASNSIVILSVSAKIYTTVDQAARSYNSMYQAQKSGSKFDGVQTGIGEEAFGLSEASSTQTTYYMMCSRVSNAYLEVSATASGSPGKDQMRPKMIAESKAILALLPTA